MLMLFLFFSFAKRHHSFVKPSINFRKNSAIFGTSYNPFRPRSFYQRIQQETFGTFDNENDNNNCIPHNITTDDLISNKKIIHLVNQLQQTFSSDSVENNDDDSGSEDDNEDEKRRQRRLEYYHHGSPQKKPKKSDHFEVITNSSISFKDVGGYDVIKKELMQCKDLLTNYEKYAKYSVRIPKGILLEGTPGNGKTMIAKAFASEAGVSFISVSGSEFTEKYVGVGSSRVRELFELARQNIPCIIFIDELDAVGRSRSNDAESSSSERDSTLNQLLVELDGFKSSTGIFLMCATNRADIIDSALLRPGRIDKKIFIPLPDLKTRQEIFNIHIKGKPIDDKIKLGYWIDITHGFSGAQIENLLNEAMLSALRSNRDIISNSDIEEQYQKTLVGFQTTENAFSKDMIHRISVHEMGHAIMGTISKFHSKIKHITINRFSPTTPGYTLFEPSEELIYTKEGLEEFIMILLAGRISEELIFKNTITTGANDDFKKASEISRKMIQEYGMGSDVVFPSVSEKYKEKIDNQINLLIKKLYTKTKNILQNYIYEINYGADILSTNNKLTKKELDKILKKHVATTTTEKAQS